MNTDNNFKSYVREDGLEITSFTNPPDPSQYSDILKFSACTNTKLRGIGVEGGTENCVDAVRGKNYELNGCTLKSHGTAAAVFKGSIDGWKVLNTLIDPHGPTDLEIGQFDNYWYVGRAPTRNGEVRGTRTMNGSAVRCQCWNADKPDADSQVVITKIPWLVWFPYFCFRYLQVRITGQVPWVLKYNPPETPTKNGEPT